MIISAPFCLDGNAKVLNIRVLIQNYFDTLRRKYTKKLTQFSLKSAYEYDRISYYRDITHAKLKNSDMAKKTH